MGVTKDQYQGIVGLRQSAKERLESEKQETYESNSALDTTTQRLLQELQIHEIELELQNEELKQSRDHLEEAHNRYLNLYEFAPVSYFTIQADGKIKQVNLTGSFLVEIDRMQLLNSNFRYLVSKSTQNIYDNFILRLFSLNLKSSCEVTLIKSNNDEVFVQIEASVNSSDNECLMAVIDITRRKLIEKSLYENAPCCFHSLNKEGFFSNINNMELKLLGYTREEVVGKMKFEDIITEDSKQTYQLSFPKFIREGHIYDKEFEMIRKDGSIVPVVISSAALNDSEGIYTMNSSYLFDNTNRKKAELALKENEVYLQKSEEKYRLLFELMPVGIIIADSLGNYLFSNQEARRLLEVTNEDFLIRKIDGPQWKFVRKDGSIMPPEEFASVKALKENRKIENEDMGIIRDNGDIIWINVTAAPVFLNNELVIVFNDTSEKVIHEKELFDVTQKLKELNATKDKFFSLIAHDLRNPFNSILGFTDLLLHNLPTYSQDNITRFITIINNSSQQVFNLLENLLFWSRSQTGTIEFRPEELDLSLRIVENVSFLENIALKKNIKILIENIEPCIVFCDKNMINTILRNLLSNALKFTPPHGQVIVSLLDLNTHIEVSIKNNGIGIDKDDIGKLFRIDSEFTKLGTSNEKGTGLGLIICKEFIEKHNGTIRVKSELGKGSEFIITLAKQRIIKTDN